MGLLVQIHVVQSQLYPRFNSVYVPTAGHDLKGKRMMECYILFNTPMNKPHKNLFPLYIHICATSSATCCNIHFLKITSDGL